jgi:hypothetical protein
VLDTVFSADGRHLISVGRDMSTKLTEVETQRFVDNISSITPGALRGGLHAVALRPGHDEVVIGGADGVPALYQIFRKTKRRIGDNANLLRGFPSMEGRVFAVDYSRDGKLIAAASTFQRPRGGEPLPRANLKPPFLTCCSKRTPTRSPATTRRRKRPRSSASATEGVKRLAEARFPCGI